MNRYIVHFEDTDGLNQSMYLYAENEYEVIKRCEEDLKGCFFKLIELDCTYNDKDVYNSK